MLDVDSKVLKVEEQFTRPKRVIIGKSFFAGNCSREQEGKEGHQRDSGQWREAWSVQILFTYFLVDMVA